MVTAPARRELVRYLSCRGLSERHASRIARISASAFRYQRRPERNVELRSEIVRLAYRHKRYGASMIGLKLWQSGWRVNHKRVERLYALSGLQVRGGPGKLVSRISDISASMGDESRRPTGAESNEKTET